MARLELTLFNNEGEATTYRQNHVSGQKLLDFWNLQIEMEKNSKKYTIVQMIEKKAEYVASLFQHSDVTAESIIHGVDSWNLLDTLDLLISKAIGVDTEDKINPKEVNTSPLKSQEIATLPLSNN